MPNEKEKQYNFDASSLFLFLNQWRIPLIVVAVFAVVVSAIFSGPAFITPKFESTVVLYPASGSSISNALLDTKAGNKSDALSIGEEEQTEQLLQLLNSNRIRDKIVEKYDLMRHYNIAPDADYRQTKLVKEYNNNVNFRRTEYMAVKINVLDKDPMTASNIANDIAFYVDSIRNSIVRERAVKGFAIVKEEYEHRRSQIRSMEDSLTVLRGYGIHDYESQAEVINQQYAIELAKGNIRAIKVLEGKLDILAKYGSAYISLSHQLEYEQEQMSLLKSKYEEAKIDATEVLPQTYIINHAFASEKKTYPIRWLIVLSSLVVALFFAAIIIVINDKIRQLGIYGNRDQQSDTVKKKV